MADAGADTAAADGVGTAATEKGAAHLFAGPGEMRARCRAIDWAATPLGPVESWAPALRTAVRLCLDAGFATCLYAGPALVLIYNEGFTAALGRKHPWALGRPAREVWPEAWAQIAPEFDRVRATGAPVFRPDQPFALERGSDGADEGFFTFAFSAVRDEDGAVVGVLSTVVETTARVRAEAALAAERERLRAVVLQAPTPMALLVGPEHRLELVNDAYKRVSGGRDVTGLPFREAFPELEGQGFFDLQDRAYATGEPWAASAVPARYDRLGTGVEDAYFDLRYEPVRDADGRVFALLNYGVDVTEQVRARQQVESLLLTERALRTEAEAVGARAEAVLASIADAFYLLDREWRFTYVNAAAEPLLQTTRDALLGRTLWEAFPDVAGSPFEGPYREAMERGRVTSAEAYFPPLGTWFDVHSYPWSGGLMVHFRDIGARKAAEAERERLVAALEVERARLSDVFQQAPAFLAVYRGADHVFDRVNDAYYQLVGHGRDLIGRPLLEALPEVRGQGFDVLLDRVLATGEPFVGREVPVRLRRTPGAESEERFVDLTYLPLTEADGSRAGIIAHGTDVTAQVEARREVERLLAESERARADAEAARTAADLVRGRLEALLEHLPVGVTLAEAPTGRLLVSNAAVRRIWGLDTPSAQVADYSALYVGFRPGSRPEAERRYASDEWPLARTLATGHPVLDEVIEILRPDGTRVLASVSAAPVRDAAGAIVGGIVMTQDVTERERLLAAERAAHARTERLQALTAALAGARTLDEVATVVVADMVVTLGARTGALASRDAGGDALVLVRTVGFPEPVAASVRRQPLELRSPLTECYRTQAPVWVESRDGPAGLDALYPPIAPVWDALGVASAAFVPLVAAGETVGVISFAFAEPRTFTPSERVFFSVLGQQAALAVERSRLFEAERAARAEAEASNRAKSEFLAVMSHELRTPLNAIGGYAELMEMGIRGPITEQQREDLGRIQRSQRHLLGLVNEVLNYAKLETGMVRYEVADVVVRHVLAEAEALVAPQARAKGLVFGPSECAGDLVARADPEKLRQVLVNLLSNAVKFTDARDGEPGRVAVTCAAADDRVRLAVGDTGIGIAADKLDAVFEPFVQVRSDFTRTAEGAGLGLAISRDLARGMGGDLTVESTPGVGSTFTLTLPRA